MSKSESPTKQVLGKIRSMIDNYKLGKLEKVRSVLLAELDCMIDDGTIMKCIENEDTVFDIMTIETLNEYLINGVYSIDDDTIEEVLDDTPFEWDEIRRVIVLYEKDI